MLAVYFGLIMFVCIVPTSVILFFQVYPKNWKDKKLILGVKNREEYRTGETLETVEKIYGKYRKSALIVVIVTCVIAVLLLFLKGMTLLTTAWTGFIFAALAALNVPHILGNKEMKDLKRRLGLGGETGVAYFDLSNAGAVHAVKPINVILPFALGFVTIVAALLVDLKVIEVEHGWLAGSFMGTAFSVMFWLMEALIIGLSLLLDGLKNEVISTDSAVNANYNRAKKKNMADFMVQFLWVHAIFGVLSILGFMFCYSEMLFMICLTAYMILIMAGIGMFVLRSKKIEERYAKEISVFADDDDQWLFGMIYYNPKDHRLNVEKRVGVGGTVNYAHPLGKVLGVLCAFAILGTILVVIWLGLTEATPLQLRIEDGKVICHQIRDEYVIDSSEIESVEWGESIGDLHVAKIAGFGTDKLLKGSYIINDDSGCKAFLYVPAVHYVKIVTKDRTYYVSASTPEETKTAYETIQTILKKGY